MATTIDHKKYLGEYIDRPYLNAAQNAYHRRRFYMMKERSQLILAKRAMTQEAAVTATANLKAMAKKGEAHKRISYIISHLVYFDVRYVADQTILSHVAAIKKELASLYNLIDQQAKSV